MNKAKLNDIVGESWADLMLPIFNDSRMLKILELLGDCQEWYPEKENVFRAFKLCPLDQLKVIIIGQDPYHTPGKATGLAFGVPENELCPPSLRIIFRNLHSTYHGDEYISKEDFNYMYDRTLEHWAKQGVLLLNTALTVEKGKAGSHAEYWHWFTEEVIKAIEEYNDKVIIVRWGKHAQSFNTKYASLDGPHPMAEYYTGGKMKFQGYFKIINQLLESINKEPIKWIRYDKRSY